MDSLCAQFEGKKCIVCSFRSIFNEVGKCTPVSDLCRTYNAKNGDCFSCYDGYELKENGSCVIKKVTNVNSIASSSTQY